MAEIKQPTDHKAKATPFVFKDAEGVEHKLPPASEGAETVPGQLTRDAIMSPDDEMAQLRLGFALLDASGADPAAIAAVYAKNTTAMIELLGKWMEYGDSDGATVPQS